MANFTIGKPERSTAFWLEKDSDGNINLCGQTSTLQQYVLFITPDGEIVIVNDCGLAGLKTDDCGRVIVRKGE